MRRLLLCALVPCFLLAGCTASAENLELTVVFYAVGKADAILMYTEDSAVLIDTGENKAGEQIVEDLRARGIERLDALIITHFDKDHVGGADKVVEGIPVGRVFEPSYEKDSKQVKQYREALEAVGLKAEALTGNISFELDGCAYAIDVANKEDYDEENDFSLVVRLTCGNVRFLFAGDAEETRLAELIDEGGLSCDVLKVPYHGRYQKMSVLFFEAAKPKYAVITSDADNLGDTVHALQMVGAQVLPTREGTVEMRCDGKSVELYE